MAATRPPGFANMTTNGIETELEPTSEASYILNTHLIMDSAKHIRRDLYFSHCVAGILSNYINTVPGTYL
jgi:hypothetical protein